MDFVLSMLRETALIPVVISVLVAAASSCFSKLECVGAIALACGFFAGWASQDWATMKPARYLDWLPYAAILLAVAAVVSAGIPNKFKWLVQAAAVVLVTWLMVPSFPRLQPTRPVATAMVAVLSWGLIQASAGSQTQVPQRVLVAGLMAMGTSVSLIMAQSFGLKFAQIAGMLTAALAGALIFRSERIVAGLTVVFLPLLCNLLFMGYASSSSDVPWYSFAIVPLAVLCFRVYPKDSDPEKTRNCIFAGVLFALVLLSAVVPAVLAHPPWEEDLASNSAVSIVHVG